MSVSCLLVACLGSYDVSQKCLSDLYCLAKCFCIPWVAQPGVWSAVHCVASADRKQRAGVGIVLHIFATVCL